MVCDSGFEWLYDIEYYLQYRETRLFTFIFHFSLVSAPIQDRHELPRPFSPSRVEFELHDL